MSNKDKPMSAEEAADILQRIANDLRILDYIDEDDVIYALAIAALREKAERENPEPLTLEQLIEHYQQGKAIWIKDGWNDGWYFISGFQSPEINFNNARRIVRIPVFGENQNWTAYAHKPGGEVPHDAD